jgi:hypothetical protein
MAKKVEVAPVQAFECAVTGKLFKTAEAALKCAEAAKKKIAKEKADRKKEKDKMIADEAAHQEKLRKADWIRMNLEDIRDLPGLLVSMAKEFYDIDIINLSISGMCFSDTLSCSHNAPLNCPTNWGSRDKKNPSSYPGWSGRISCESKAPKDLIKSFGRSSFDNSFNDIMFGHFSGGGLFRGMHTSSGCGGRFNDPGCKTSIGFGVFVQDFPKLQEKYIRWKSERAADFRNREATAAAVRESRNFANNNEAALALQQTINEITEERRVLMNTLAIDYMASHLPSQEIISDDFDLLKANFGSRY